MDVSKPSHTKLKLSFGYNTKEENVVLLFLHFIWVNQP